MWSILWIKLLLSPNLVCFAGILKSWNLCCKWLGYDRYLCDKMGIMAALCIKVVENAYTSHNATGLLKNWKKQHFICSYLTLFIVPFFLFSLFFSFLSLFSFFLSFFLFFFFFFFLGGGGGATAPQPPLPPNDAFCLEIAASIKPCASLAS